MSRLTLIIGLLIALNLANSLFAGEFQEPTFTIEADVQDRFFIRQVNDYYIGNFDDKLPTTEVMQLIRDGAFRLSDYFYIEADRYFYFAYYVRNLSDKPQTIYVRWGSQFTESGGYILDHLKNPQNARPLTRFPSDDDVFFGEVPTGDSLIVGFRLGDGTMTGKIGSATIRDLHSMIEITTTEEAINAAVLGIVGIMALYNLGMFLFFRKAYFLYYIIYSIATLITLSYINGDLIWSVPKMGFWSMVSTVSLLWFCYGSLPLQNKHRMWKIMVFTMMFADIGLGTLTMIYQTFDYMFISAPASLLVCTLLSIRCAWDRYSPAIYLILGWSIFFLGVLASMISLKSGEFNILSYGMVFGFALEICFFSFALGEKVRLAERQAIEANIHAFEQLKKVFYPHQIQQIKAGRELETTMPTGKAKACVLCFDIIESSNIAIPYRDRFLEAGIKRCVKVMDQGYDANQLTARAYRIKEMGDGFLCSVGFPFETGEESSIPSSAVALAEDFIREFQAHVDNNDLRDQVFCSIGIAFGVIEGRYPVTGAVEYDVYGPAVISANRYERVRKDLFSAKTDCHIVTIQDKVYDELSEDQQREFECLNVETLNYSIRGDRRAKLLYWLERRASGSKLNRAS